MASFDGRGCSVVWQGPELVIWIVIELRSCQLVEVEPGWQQQVREEAGPQEPPREVQVGLRAGSSCNAHQVQLARERQAAECELRTAEEGWVEGRGAGHGVPNVHGAVERVGGQVLAGFLAAQPAVGCEEVVGKVL